MYLGVSDGSMSSQQKKLSNKKFVQPLKRKSAGPLLLSVSVYNYGIRMLFQLYTFIAEIIETRPRFQGDMVHSVDHRYACPQYYLQMYKKNSAKEYAEGKAGVVKMHDGHLLDKVCLSPILFEFSRSMVCFINLVSSSQLIVATSKYGFR
jgi:hypothetical protein